MYYNMEDFVILRKQSQKVDFDNSVSILEKSAAFNGVELLFNDKMETSCSRCELMLRKEKLAWIQKGFGRSVEEAHSSASYAALKALELTNYTLLIKWDSAWDSGKPITLEDMSPKPKPAAVPLSESNIGSQMLRKMGWTGGGIGKDEQGISEPLALQDNKSKRGLGHERANMPSFQALARPFLGKFIGSHLSELKFGTDFSENEKSLLVKFARQMGLLPEVYHTATGDTGVIIRKKHFSPIAVVTKLLRKGGQDFKYYLVFPQRDSHSKT